MRPHEAVEVPAGAKAAATPDGAATTLDSPGETAVRLLAGFAGFGAAAVSLAISSSLLTAAASARQWLLLPALAAALWGAVLLGWTVAALRKGSFPLPRLSAVLLPAAGAAHLLAIVIGAEDDLAGLNVSNPAALLLTLTVVAAKGWLARRTATGQASRRTDDGGHAAGGSGAGGPGAGSSGAGRMLVAAFAGALAVAAIATPGLAASTAGQFAVPHGSHSGGGAAGGHHSP
ncbi:hypothetical protein [Arthrobacter sp. ISL-28]|uniref:hypothetical protein n=1 Tax=Arthrobacter sp. ISL-28 TaxID=2819108 RepID=UPI001BE66F56|nr:hypothetical protein [Arthrobacter sp. ISL-28]MBT2520588.1 hypothetical protein [Arthrobacter sp. ISL-28]